MPLLLTLALAGAAATAASDTLRLSLSRDGRYAPGDDVELDVRSRIDGYLLVLHEAPDGSVRVLYPHRPVTMPSTRANRRYDVRDRSGREELFRAADPGTGTITAVLSAAPIRADTLVRDGHWYRLRTQSLLGGGDLESRVVELLPALGVHDAHVATVRYTVDHAYRPPQRVIHDHTVWGPGAWGVRGWGPGMPWGGGFWW